MSSDLRLRPRTCSPMNIRLRWLVTDEHRSSRVLLLNASSEHEKNAQEALGLWFASIEVALSTLKISLGTTVSCRWIEGCNAVTPSLEQAVPEALTPNDNWKLMSWWYCRRTACCSLWIRLPEYSTEAPWHLQIVLKGYCVRPGAHPKFVLVEQTRRVWGTGIPNRRPPGTFVVTTLFTSAYTTTVTARKRHFSTPNSTQES
jgi:hypothetical protein